MQKVFRKVTLEKDQFDDPQIENFYKERICQRIKLLEEELSQIKTGANIQSESEDFEMTDPHQLDLSDEEEKEVQSPALSKKSSSRMQKDFDKSLKRAQTQGSVVLEQFDFTDMKRVLKERLVNYKQAIDYWIQIGQDKEIVKDLVTKVHQLQ